MPVVPLPDHPDLERLKGHAKTLRDLVHAGVDGAIALVREHHPRLTDLAAGSPAALGFKLADAQLTIARHYGYATWPKLRRYIEIVDRLSRSPHAEVHRAGAADGDGDGRDSDDTLADDALADELLRLACLNYGADSPDRWRAAALLLRAHPHLAERSLSVAATSGDVRAAAAVLAADAGAASREAGPFRWPPLVYLTYSRLDWGDDAPSGSDPLAVARLLLAHGADPNAGYLWDGLPSPFTALTGVFGHGEQGAPAHRDELALARLLLEAGACANDSQTIYNRGLGDVAQDDTAFLELLLEFGFGRGDGGPWRRLLGHEHLTPRELLAEALQHAAEAGLVQRVRLLLANGADPDEPGSHPGFQGRRPYEGAVANGNVEIARLLADAGATTSGVDVLMEFVGACLNGDRAAVAAMLDRDRARSPQERVHARALDERPDLVARAAELARPTAIALLVEQGFDVNARHRTTALHEAAWRGDRAIVDLLLGLGADATIVDAEHDSTPGGWARHGRHTELADHLDRVAREAVTREQG